MANKQSSYLAYMLRLWQVDNQGQPVWRASLESPHTGERQGFANLEQLFAFLTEKVGDQSWAEEPMDDVVESEDGLPCDKSDQ